MKILFFHRWVGVHYGGTEDHVKNLAAEFLKRGHQVSLLTREGRQLPDLSPEIKIWRVGRNFGESDFSYNHVIPLYWHTTLFMIKSFFFLISLRLLRGQKYDVISVHFVTEAWVARIFRFLFKVPYVFLLEGYTPLEAEMAKKADAVVAISQNLVEQVFKNHGFRPQFIPVGVDGAKFNLTIDGAEARQRLLGGFQKLIISVGRIEPRKDYTSLLTAAQMIKSRGFSYRFLIVGEGIDRAKILRLIEAENLNQEVVMLGAVTDREKAQLYRAADLFVLSTLYEGFGIVFVEAMACGLPVVSTRVGAVPEVVGDAGILVESKNPNSLAETIIKILSDDNLYKQLRSKALVTAGNYDWNKLIVEYEDAYQSVIKK